MHQKTSNNTKNINAYRYTSCTWNSVHSCENTVHITFVVTQLEPMFCSRQQHRLQETRAYHNYVQFLVSSDWVSKQCFTSSPTQYRLYGRRFYRSKDPTNSIKVLKEMLQKRKKTTKTTKYRYTLWVKKKLGHFFTAITMEILNRSLPN